jgi:hypothetical protein
MPETDVAPLGWGRLRNNQPRTPVFLDKWRMIRSRRFEESREMRLGRSLTVIVAASFVGVVPPRRAAADEWNKRTVLTFSQAVAVPGKMLSAGTYVFQLAESQANRHLVQVSDQSGRILVMVVTTAVYRPSPEDKTRLTFSEQSAGAPRPITTWFYPGRIDGEQFVYAIGSSPGLSD